MTDSERDEHFETDDLIIDCIICMEELTEPFTLSCGHNSCIECAQKLSKKLRNFTSITCPKCRVINQISDKGKIQINLEMKQLLGKRKQVLK